MVSREDFALPKENLLLVAVGFVILILDAKLFDALLTEVASAKS